MAKAKTHRALLSVSSLTGLSRVLGLCRDVVCANVFGASGVFDAFLVAFQLPNFMRRLFAEGAFAQAFVPLYNHVLADPKSTDADCQGFVDDVMGLLSAALLLLTLLAWLFAPWLIRMYAPGFYMDTSAQRFDLAVAMLRWTFPYITCISLTACVAAILNSHGRFVMGAWMPVLLNVFLIAGSGLSYLYFAADVVVLARTVLIAGLAQCAIMYGYAYRCGFRFRWRFRWRHPWIQRLGRLMLLGVLGAIVGQLSLLVDTFLASLLPAGAISWLYYSQRLVYLPVGIFAVAITTVMTPLLAKANNETSLERFSAALSWSTELVWLIAMPASLGLMVMAYPIVVVFFHHGSFSSRSVHFTQWALMAFACGLPAFMLNKILMAALYAQQKMQAAVRIGLKGCVVNIVVSLCLMPICLHIGIALATVIAAWYQYFGYRQLLCDVMQPKMWAVPLKALGVAAIMASLLYGLGPTASAWLRMETGVSILLLLGAILLAVVGYECVMRRLQCSIWQTFTRAPKLDNT